MLILMRKQGQRIMIGDNITLVVTEVRGDKVKIGIEAPRDIPVYREEVELAVTVTTGTRNDG